MKVKMKKQMLPENRIEDVKSWEVAGLDGLECFRAQASKHHYGRHSHREYAIGVIEEGVGGNDYRGGVHYIPAGSIVVMNPDEVHTGFAADEGPLSYRMLYVERKAFAQILPDKADWPYFQTLCIQDSYWAKKLQGLHQILETSRDTLEQQERFTDTLSAFAHTYGQTITLTAGREPDAVKQIKSFLHAHYHQNISIDELVQITHLSRAHLIRTFRRAVGMPPYAYLLQIRIEKAKQLLAQGMPVAQVAYEVGFVDQSHLTHRFKLITGITPKQYAIGHYCTRKSPDFC
jgi:AraC-like DNA-binding protein